MKTHTIAALVLGFSGCLLVAQTDPKKEMPQSRQASIGDTVIRVTALELMQTQTFSRVSSHFAGTPMADKLGFMYEGTGTAGIPVTEESRTVFWLSASKVPAATAFQPDKATLKTQSGQVIACITNQTIHMSCPGWGFHNWRVEHGHITGFIVFPRVQNPCDELRLPYVDQGKVGELVFQFGKEK